MSRHRCDSHGVALVFDETTEESRMVGNLSFQREEVAYVKRFVCPVDGCRESRQVRA